MSLFNTGVRPAIDQYLLDEAAKTRDYGDYWSASSAGYCMRRNIFERLKVPHVKEDARKQRVFSSGHIFHSWIQDITKKAGISVAQEVELQDETLMVRGHFDDLILVSDILPVSEYSLETGEKTKSNAHLILYDYKTQSSRAFSYKRPNMSHYHKMQLGTYMYMLRNYSGAELAEFIPEMPVMDKLTEARILKISKDDLRMSEEQLLWTPELEKEVVGYWNTLNGYWKNKKIPKCTCADYEGGFLAKEAYNDYFYEGEPCSIEWYNKHKKEVGDARSSSK